MKAGLIWLAHLPRSRKATFTFDGHVYPYFRHNYNVTWLNERCIEIPIMREVIAHSRGARMLEVGNVLSCYDRTLKHTVIDKYETPSRPDFYAEDAETFTRGAPYDLIVSISTLEHVGWDETPKDTGKISRTIRHLRSLLKPKGELVFTAPVGYSPPLDEVIDEGDGFISRRCLKRVSALNEWEETDWASVKGSSFHSPYPFANALAVVRVASVS